MRRILIRGPLLCGILAEYNWTQSSGWTQSWRQLQAVDQILAEEQPGDLNWLLADQLGSIRDYRSVASPGSSTHVDYDPFGQPISATDVTNADQHLIGYAGGERDAESGLMHFGRRYYDPSISRFLSTDPIDADAKGYPNRTQIALQIFNPIALMTNCLFGLKF